MDDDFDLKAGPEGPAKAVVKDKLAEAQGKLGGKTDFDPGDRFRKGEDENPFKRPQAQERLTAVLDPEHHSSKEPGEMPQEAIVALHSNQVYDTHIPKRH
ncbi:hypothetical protein COCSUDRAFT_59864 [Coccomyxa subellipsoidea C-169]|uniref:Uncharacterized protein n=1 Tax=Coccomyxa subellipsoidea (strain C-169) TaxID=574566 RepID=I0YKM2_COCSC|nr:hypothetical protein COCSUDRAFT_59864 [Coccomyxa subellipsoidea C-169]EIE18941.1 hypothetical protein COCSUDRAFT_59864 [Coccomyxa subellipsoidea C-169]|eukprot:XP_005643485.1 hypothetical protein COCSUDRAFT_59864 [Coccomyxa subellipsoidea C-169]